MLQSRFHAVGLVGPNQARTDRATGSVTKMSWVAGLDLWAARRNTTPKIWGVPATPACLLGLSLIPSGQALHFSRDPGDTKPAWESQGLPVLRGEMRIPLGLAFLGSCRAGRPSQCIVVPTWRRAKWPESNCSSLLSGAAFSVSAGPRVLQPPPGLWECLNSSLL